MKIKVFSRKEENISTMSGLNKVPTKKSPISNSHVYDFKLELGKQYGLLCRKKGSVEAPEEILLDQNELAENETYFQVITKNEEFD